MGALHEQAIPTLFQGVSRQPDSLRFIGQVDDAENVTFSVETGGFSKRNGTEIVKRLDEPNLGTNRLHVIAQSDTEKYAVVHYGPREGAQGHIRIYELLTGREREAQVAHPDDDAFFNKDPSRYEFLNVLDYTFVVDKDMVVQMEPPVSDEGFRAGSAQLTRANAKGTYQLSVSQGDRTWTGTHNSTNIDEDPLTVATKVLSSLSGQFPSGEGWRAERDGSYIVIRNVSGLSFTLSTVDPHGNTAWKSVTTRASGTDDLPARAHNNHLVEIRKASEDEGYWLKFVTESGRDYGIGAWTETVPIGTSNSFNAATMPRALVRDEAGHFRFERIDWAVKRAGGEGLVPRPEFVGRTINDLVFRANRLGILSGEHAYFSASGDYFRFWPQGATQLLPDDPFGLTNSTNRVSSFAFGVPFRRSLFIMSGEAQFEAYGEPFTPETGQLEVATQYPANTRVRPVVIGDEMYFVSETGKDVTLNAYVYNEGSVSEIANDVSRHVRGLLRGPIIQMAASSLESELYLLPETRDKVYVHKYCYEGSERVQSSWGVFKFNGVVHSIAYQDGYLYLLMGRNDGGLYLERLASVPRSTELFETYPVIDLQHTVQGIYNPETNETTWETPLANFTPVVLTTDLWPERFRMLTVETKQVADHKITARGRWDEKPVMIGENFASKVALSRQYIRDGDVAVVNGRLQLRSMILRYENSGYFEVHVKPDARDSRTFRMTGRILGADSNRVQQSPLLDGKFRFMVGSNAETVGITIYSDKHMPFTITSGAWVGFFNEVTRQDNG